MKFNKEKILLKYNSKCAYCGCDLTLKTITTDHFIPKRYGGSDEESNINPCCRLCNCSKHCWSIRSWRESIANQLECAKDKNQISRTLQRFGFKLPILEIKPIVFYFEMC